MARRPAKPRRSRRPLYSSACESVTDQHVCRRQRWPAAHGAFDRSGQTGVESSRPRDSRPLRRACRWPSRAGWPGASENVARGSRHDASQQERRAADRAAARHELACSADAIELGVRQRHERRRTARHQRQVRGVRRRTRLACRRPLHRPPGQPEKRLVASPADRTRDSTVTIGDEAICARRVTHLGQRRRVAVERGRDGEPRHCRDCARCQRSPEPRPPTTSVLDPRDSRRRMRYGPLAAAPLDVRRAGSAYIRCSGLVGSAIAGTLRGSRPEHLGEHARERAARPPRLAGWLSAASASGSHSISRNRAVCPLRIEPALDRLARRRAIATADAGQA